MLHSPFCPSAHGMSSGRCIGRSRDWRVWTEVSHQTLLTRRFQSIPDCWGSQLDAPAHHLVSLALTIQLSGPGDRGAVRHASTADCIDSAKTSSLSDLLPGLKGSLGDSRAMAYDLGAPESTRQSYGYGLSQSSALSPSPQTLLNAFHAGAPGAVGLLCQPGSYKATGSACPGALAPSLVSVGGGGCLSCLWAIIQKGCCALAPGAKCAGWGSLASQ